MYALTTSYWQHGQGSPQWLKVYQNSHKVPNKVSHIRMCAAISVLQLNARWVNAFSLAVGESHTYKVRRSEEVDNSLDIVLTCKWTMK